MSTYYYLLCDKHQEVLGCASTPFLGHPCNMGKSKQLLPHFLHAHAACSLLVRDEFSFDNRQDEYERWYVDTLEDMLKKKRD